MFEFKKNRYTTKLIIELNNAMPHYNKICIEKTTRRKQQLQKCKNKSFKSKIQYLIIKAPTNNVRLQLDKTQTTRI